MDFDADTRGGTREMPGRVLTVVKLGGGMPLAGGERALASLCETLAEAAASLPIVVVPGGGSFGRCVRDADRCHELQGATLHRMTLLAMDLFGCLLGDLIPGAVLCRSVTRARLEADSGHVAVLLPGEQLADAERALGHGPVTSDSVALWVAGVAGHARALFLRPADGLFAEWPSPDAAPTPLSDPELANMPTCGDEDSLVPEALHAAGVDTWIVSGRDPARLLELLRVGDTTPARVAAGNERK